MFRVQITSKFNFFFLTSIFMFLCNLLVGKWKRSRTQYGWQWSSNTTKILERMGNNKECKSGTSSRARLVLDLQPILTESVLGRTSHYSLNCQRKCCKMLALNSVSISAGNIYLIFSLCVNPFGKLGYFREDNLCREKLGSELIKTLVSLWI